MNAFLDNQVSWSVLYAFSALFGGGLLLAAFWSWRHRLRLSLVSGWVDLQQRPEPEEPSEAPETQPASFGHVCLAGAKALAKTRPVARPPAAARPAPEPTQEEPPTPPAQPDADFLDFLGEVRATAQERRRAGRTPKQELSALRKQAADARRQLNGELAGTSERPFLPLRNAVTRRVPRVKRGRPRGVTVRLRRPQPLPGFQEAVPFQPPNPAEAGSEPALLGEAKRVEGRPGEPVLLGSAPLAEARPEEPVLLGSAAPSESGPAPAEPAPSVAIDPLAALRALADELERAPDPARAEALGSELAELGQRFARIAAENLVEVSDAA